MASECGRNSGFQTLATPLWKAWNSVMSQPQECLDFSTSPQSISEFFSTLASLDGAQALYHGSWF